MLMAPCSIPFYFLVRVWLGPRGAGVYPSDCTYRRVVLLVTNSDIPLNAGVEPIITDICLGIAVILWQLP